MSSWATTESILSKKIDFEELMHLAEAHGESQPSVQFAVESAINDLCSKLEKIPFNKFINKNYEPTVKILEHLYPLVSKNGIIILDDYMIFPGETKAVNEYFKNTNVVIEKPLFVNTPHYIIKP